MLATGLRVAGQVAALPIAAAVLGAAAYLLSWGLLLDGPRGSDTTFHLSLARWIESTFPSTSWWYPWDANGIPYREGYPLAAHWVAVAISRASHLSLSQGMQVVQFAVNPLCAIGVYCYCAWRLRRPDAGLVAGLLYLLSPMAWTFIADWGFYANQAGTVLFMPALIAIDICSARWVARDRGWRLRLSALSAIGLCTVLGMVAPAVMGAALLAVPAYTLATRTGGWRDRARWLLLVTPALIGGSLLLSAFWALPLRDYLGVVGSRQSPATYSPALYPLQPLSQILSWNGLHPQDVHDRISLSPSVWIPALAGLIAIFWDRRVLVLALLAGFGMLSVSAGWLYAVVFGIPVVSNLVNPRAGMLYLQFGVPILGAVGLVVVAPSLAHRGLGRLRVPLGVQIPLLAGLAAAGVVLGAINVGAFSNRVDGFPGRLAYGIGTRPTELRDLWSRHHDDVCEVTVHPRPCDSPALSSSLSVIELIDACRTRTGILRTDLAICTLLGSAANPSWDDANNAVIGETRAWCAGHQDRVCQTFYQPLSRQLLDPGQWRRPQVGCVFPDCAARPGEAVSFPSPPERAAVDANSGPLLKSFHQLSGGGQTYSYNYQLLPSPELDAFTLDTLLQRKGADAKAQMAARAGVDTVVLGGGEEGQAADYDRLGWKRVGTEPLTYANPNPSGLAAQRPAGTVLIVGSAPNTTSAPYNTIFERAVHGMIPADSAWLVRGRTPTIDDYSDQELARYSAVLLLGYQYHDRTTAWDRLDRYVGGGGRLFVETGWQNQDPDWNGGRAPAALPAAELRWDALDSRAPVLVQGARVLDWGPMTYGGGGWGASSSASVRPGAEELVKVGSRVVAARWSRGRGRVVWSGMNLIAHAEGAHLAAEDDFLAAQWRWLLPETAPASPLRPTWTGDDRASISIPPSGPTWMLFRESAAPGWSAELRWPGGSRPLAIEPAEQDFMLVRLDGAPSGARVVFQYGPTWRDRVWWGTSVLTLLGLVAWLAWPRPFQRLSGGVAAAASRRLSGMRDSFQAEEEET